MNMNPQFQKIFTKKGINTTQTVQNRYFGFIQKILSILCRPSNIRSFRMYEVGRFVFLLLRGCKDIIIGYGCLESSLFSIIYTKDSLKQSRESILTSIVMVFYII